MLFLYVAHKGTGGDSARTATRVRHLEYMIRHRSEIATGGSFQDEGGGWGGMALILDLQDESAVRSWIAAEPYAVAGVFDRYELAPFRQLIPESHPGLLNTELRVEKEAASARNDDDQQSANNG